MVSIKAIIKMEKVGENDSNAIVLFPELAGSHNPLSGTAYVHVGQHIELVDITKHLEESCRNPETDDEKAECFDLMMEVISRYKNGTPIDIIWITGKFTDADYKKWEKARKKDLKS